MKWQFVQPGVGPRPASKKNYILAAHMLLIGAFVTALTPAMPALGQSSNNPRIVQSQIRYVSPASGKQMYQAYCASCHGVDGRGTANATAALPQSPTDLSMLSIHNGGRFPAYQVRDVLLDNDAYHDRAGDAMPVWILAFQSLQRSHPDLVRLRVYNLVTYLQTMQTPSQTTGAASGGSLKPQ